MRSVRCFVLSETQYVSLASLHEELSSFFKSRRFAEAADLLRERRETEMRAAELEMASAISSMLATVLTMDSRDAEALEAAREAERLDPASVEPKLKIAYLLLRYGDAPPPAPQKTSEVMPSVERSDPHWYKALALHGTALARTGDTEGTLGVFRTMTSPELMEQLRRAEYVGVYDLSVVSELVSAKVALPECRRYLEVVAQAPPEWPHLRQQLEKLLAETRT